jgi:DNA modification methylase
MAISNSVQVRHRTRPSNLPSESSARKGSEKQASNTDPARGDGGLTNISDLAVEWRRISELVPYANNPRTHTRKQIRQIADSIKEFGFTNPVLIDEFGGIVAGHGRAEAARFLGLEEVPTIRLEHLTEARKRAYIIADNRLAELAGWDKEILAIELQGLTEIELDFDVEITGFETGEIDLLIESLEVAGETEDADEIPDVDETQPPVSLPCDLWLLGPHRLLCGNALEGSALETLMADTKAEMVFIDPPYNVMIDGNVCGSGRIKHREFVMASGEMSDDEFTGFLTSALSTLARHSADGSVHFVCMDWRHASNLLHAGGQVYSELKNLCVWVKDNGGMGTFYRSRHELVFAFKNGTAPHINTFELGQYGRRRTNVWEYPGVNTLRSGRLEELEMHPTVKPVALVADAVRDCSRRGGVVLDTFAGSGTTIIACQHTGRIAHAMELDPRYVDVAVQRWENVTAETARHLETGLTFAEISEARGHTGQEHIAESDEAWIASGEQDHDQ